MAYLNANERTALVEELSKMTYVRAKWKLQHIDPKARLVVYRNVQNVNEWMTRYELPSLGTKVTLIEGKNNPDNMKGEKGSNVKETWQQAAYNLIKVIVEPTTANRT